MKNIRVCPNCGAECEDLGTLTLICWECGLQFLPRAEDEENNGGYNYDE